MAVKTLNTQALCPSGTSSHDWRSLQKVLSLTALTCSAPAHSCSPWLVIQAVKTYACVTVLMHILSLCTSFVGSLQPCSHCKHCSTQTAALLGNVQELRLHERLSQNRNLVQFWGHCVKQGCIYLVLELMEVNYLQ